MPQWDHLQQEFGGFDPDLLAILAEYVSVHPLLAIAALQKGQSAKDELEVVEKVFARAGLPLQDKVFMRSGLAGDGSSVNSGRFNGIAAKMKWLFLWCTM